MGGNLTSADLKMFARLGVSADLLARAGVHRVTDAQARRELGVTRRGDMSGIVFPYPDPETGTRVSARLRRDHPEVDGDGKPENKYISPYGDNRHLYFAPGAGPLLSDVMAPVLFIEAEKSALAITALAEKVGRRILAVATGGCWGWKGKTGFESGPNGERTETRGPLPDHGRIELKGRRVVIGFDANVASNWKVRNARQVYAETLAALGADIFYLNLPEESGLNGPDDYIAIHGGGAFLKLFEAAEEWRTTIVLHAGRHPEAVDRAEEVLLSHGESLLFQRGGEIVRIVELETDQRSGAIRRKAGTTMLVSVTAVALTETFDRLIRWERFSETKDGPKPHRVDCPSRVAAAYLSRLGFWKLPALTGIISAPLMRHDGTILHQAGYDYQTGLFLTENWPELAGSPSRADALAALSRLERPFSEFPFVGPQDRSVLIAAVLTCIQRRLLESAPLFGFTAPTQRTGKSLLAECIAIIGTGIEAPAMAVSGDREEMRKAVTAVIREGHAVVNLDNIEHPLHSPDLSRAITQPVYQDRILGENKTVRVPPNLLWTATGNNLAFRGDLAVRALLCRLDAKVERPEERHFRIDDLKAYVLEHRREFVTAALTIVRAYAVDGRPDQELTPWGGFDEWSRTVRAPLVWLAVADPCATRKHVIEDDPDRELAIAVLMAWRASFGDKSLRTSGVIEQANSDTELKSSLLSVASDKDNPHEIDPRRLGQKLRSWKDKITGGLRLEHGSGCGSHATWRVRDCRADGADGADRFQPTGVHPPSPTHQQDGGSSSKWPESKGPNGTNGSDGGEGEGVRV